MSIDTCKTLTLDGEEYFLVPKVNLTVSLVAKIIGRSTQYIYQNMKYLKEGVHYFKPNGGKIILTQDGVTLLEKGGFKDENKQRKHISRQKKQISIHQFINRWKKKTICNRNDQ